MFVRDPLHISVSSFVHALFERSIFAAWYLIILLISFTAISAFPASPIEARPIEEAVVVVADPENSRTVDVRSQELKPRVTPTPTPEVRATLAPTMSPVIDSEEGARDRSPESVSVSTPEPTATPEPTPTPSPTPVPFSPPGARSFSPRPMTAGYTPGVSTIPYENSTTNALLGRLGYSAQSLYSAGVVVRAHSGLVAKECGGASGRLSVYGLAVKPFSRYATCPNGKPIIPDDYKTPSKCTVHYTTSTSSASSWSTGNATAVLAHEIAHCLHFIYGEPFGLNGEYLQLRPDAAGSLTETREVFADDYMICKHGVNTSWGAGSYYNVYVASYPSDSFCKKFVELTDRYLPL